jgi:hypothetical protein
LHFEQLSDVIAAWTRHWYGMRVGIRKILAYERIARIPDHQKFGAFLENLVSAERDGHIPKSSVNVSAAKQFL